MTGHLTVSAFAPICNPAQSPWGQKAFSGYLGSDRDTWQGRDDQFLSANQLLPEDSVGHSKGPPYSGAIGCPPESLHPNWNPRCRS
ncbi:hypothetical protein NQZ68_012738 [Dissostichus eleginoides]|nr:hypothetical protein NQZ68_012738 [Dissostichus eleginoides]